jgi:hypothetical protein
LTQAPAVVELATRLSSLTTGLYVGGSLASGDFRPGVSDIDAVALVEQPPNPEARRTITAEHRRLVGDVPDGAALHCAYLSRRHVAERGFRHWTWAFQELFRRPFSGIARAELLLADPIVVSGPAPSTWLPPMGPDDLRDAARAELSGYWLTTVRKRAVWQQDVYVDQGLTTVARADITIAEGRLVTKSEAIAHLADLGLPAEMLDGVTRRRRGERVAVAALERRERAEVVRRFVADEIARLTQATTARRTPP